MGAAPEKGVIMKIDIDSLNKLREASEVIPGNVYPAKGGRKTPGTEYWMVISVSGGMCHVVGFDAEGLPVSTASYYKHAMRERPLIGHCNLDELTLRTVPL